MKMKSLLAGVAAVAALVMLTACSDTNDDQSAQNRSSASLTASSAAAEPHNQADVMFAQHMIPHHEQAIEMSDVVLAKDGIDPRVIELANQIKAAQGPEIDRMQGWLTEWGQSMMPSGQRTTSSMPGMGMPGDGGMGMNGMMSAEDMAALQNAQGVDASRLYLTQMIVHHQGAIAMAQNEIDSGQYPDTIAMARSIADTQQREIITMQNILVSL
ncbi:DUF305 domain-containing protein [Nocardia sp. 348MFTsu5.1]|uniref:DUF305 domain-containing protein n=1 Tax=Nocardia sp. 348MFTsu5.1 TaxID=1172185 RepID=UPI0003A54A38|nr:DUF305 domain-containing protein [Nocardia sp. 348MFTsu5.1]